MNTMRWARPGPWETLLGDTVKPEEVARSASRLFTGHHAYGKTGGDARMSWPRPGDSACQDWGWLN